MKDRKQLRIAVDVRCIQDPACFVRGIGQHSLWILKEAKRHLPPQSQLIAIEDSAYPPLQQEERDLFDQITQRPSIFDLDPPDVFLQPAANSAYPQARFGRLLSAPEVLKSVIIYDFIPWDQPHIFIRDEAAKLLAVSQLIWTRGYDLYFPISGHSAKRLGALLGISDEKIKVTGACLRPSIEGVSVKEIPSLPFSSYFLSVFSISAHKNPEAPVIAHARLSAKGSDAGMVIAGGDPLGEHVRLTKLHEKEGGRPGSLIFRLGPTDAELAQLYRGAVALVAPSYDEGFCLPIVEALSQGCPVLASKRGSQPELVPQPECHFEPDDHEQLERLMSGLIKTPASRSQLLEKQAGVVKQYTSEEVGTRFWQGVLAGCQRDRSAPNIAQKKLPTLSLVLPDLAGPSIDGLHAGSLIALTKLATVEVHSHRKDWAFLSGQVKPHSFSIRPYLSGRSDRILSVLDGSPEADAIAGHVRWHGGACLLHDTSIAPEGKLSPDRQELLSNALSHASPVLSHTTSLETLVDAGTGDIVQGKLPFCGFQVFSDDEVSLAGRHHAQMALGWDPGRFHVLTTTSLFKKAALSHAVLESIDNLTKSGVKICLHFVQLPGTTPKIWKDQVAMLGCDESVDLCGIELDQADAGTSMLAFRAADFGLVGGALAQNNLQLALSCLSAGMPTLTDFALGEYLKECPVAILASNTSLGENLAGSIENALAAVQDVNARTERRSRFLDIHNCDRYAKLLLQHLGLSS